MVPTHKPEDKDKLLKALQGASAWHRQQEKKMNPGGYVCVIFSVTMSCRNCLRLSFPPASLALTIWRCSRSSPRQCLTSRLLMNMLHKTILIPNQPPSNHEPQVPHACHESHGDQHKSHGSQIDPTKNPTKIIGPRDPTRSEGYHKHTEIDDRLEPKK
jgi:hypothetical protein